MSEIQVIAVLGGQWGDEGKGKIVDWAAEFIDVSARATGGNNAGHTVMVQGEKHVFHLIPSAATWGKVECILGNGMVIDPLVLLQEMDILQKKGYSIDNLFISGRAHVILLYHRMLDYYQEQNKGDKKIGTTNRGIGPSYGDKMHRTGIRMNDLLSREILTEKIGYHLWEKFDYFKHLYNYEEDNILQNLQNSLSKELLFDEYKEKLLSLTKLNIPNITSILVDIYLQAGKKLQPYLTDTNHKLHQALVNGKTILLEGAQGILLDIDHGTYPFVTSSNPSLGGLKTGLGISKIDEVYSVIKAYTTRVGSGPFVTEMEKEMGDYVRQQGQEYGATTGRPRRCGWHDSVLTRHVVQINGPKIVITKLDILTGLEKLKICDSYKYMGKKRIFNGEIYFLGKIIREFPADSTVLDSCVPYQWIELSGWKEDISGIRNFFELPVAAKQYLQKIEELSGAEICAIGVGPERKQMIVLPGKWAFVAKGNNSSPKYKAIIYDMDNTLVATNGFVFDLLKKTAQEVVKTIPFTIPADEDILTVLKQNLSFEAIFSELFPNPPRYADNEQLCNIILTRYRETAKLLPFYSTERGNETVMMLKNQGMVQGVVTNRVKMAAERLNQAGYPEMDFLTAPGKEEERKPSGKAFAEALKFVESRGIKRKEILSIGDHPDDYLASKEANLNFVAVLTGLTAKDEFMALGLEEKNIIKNLGELSKLIRG